MGVEIGNEVFYTEEIVLRKEALSKGLKRYFTGEPCKHGHIAHRAVNCGSCCECRRLRTKRWREEGGRGVERKTYKGKTLPPVEVLNYFLLYEKETGNLYWKDRPPTDKEDERTYKTWKSRWQGKVAGAIHYANGYVEVRVDNKLYKAHRLIWKMVTGEEPTEFLDHINGVTYDNRFCNLREATPQENARNSKSWSEAEYKGVLYDKKSNTFTGNFCVDDKTVFSRGYLTAKEAAEWYDDQVKDVYGEFAKLNFKEGGDV